MSAINNNNHYIIDVENDEPTFQATFNKEAEKWFPADFAQIKLRRIKLGSVKFTKACGMNRLTRSHPPKNVNFDFKGRKVHFLQRHLDAIKYVQGANIEVFHRRAPVCMQHLNVLREAVWGSSEMRHTYAAVSALMEVYKRWGPVMMERINPEACPNTYAVFADSLELANDNCGKLPGKDIPVTAWKELAGFFIDFCDYAGLLETVNSVDELHVAGKSLVLF